MRQGGFPLTREKRSRWTHWWAAVGLALAGLALVVGASTGRSAASRTPPSPHRGERAEPPSPQQEQLWAGVGLNEAWYIANGYTDAPPTTDRRRTTANGPRLILEPRVITFTAYADQPAVLSTTVSVSNGGTGTLNWVVQPAPGGSFTPTLVPTSGLQGKGFTLTVDSALYTRGTLAMTYTRRFTVSAMPSNTLDSPQTLTVSLYVDPHLPRLWLDTNKILFRASATTPGVYTRTVEVRNVGGYTLAWHTHAVSTGVRPLVTPTTGVQDGLITITVDSRGYPSATAVYTGHVVVDAASGSTLFYPVLDAPQEILVQLQIIRHSAYLPQIVKAQSPTPTPIPSPTPTPTPDPLSPEVRALWITRYDWTYASGPEGPADIDRIVANAAGAGFNTLFFQVRAHGDAYYTPGLEPWSARLNDDGVLGRDPGWDPLAYIVQQAHARGLQVHAYVNVYTAWLGVTAPPPNTTPEHVFWTWSHAYTWDDWRHWHWNTGVMPLNSSYLWASPGVDGVRDHVVAVVSDIVTRYDVDGVHLDLVRYYNSSYSYDPISNAVAGGAKTPARDQWQRDRVSDLVGRVYAAIQGIRSDVRLSAAVWFCYYADGCGYGLSSGYADHYQDSLGWLSSGRVDAIAPMLYEWQGFEDLAIWRTVMEQFQSANAGRHVYPGISGDFDDFDQVAARIQAARDAGAAGHAIFSYGAVDLHGYWDDFATGPYAQPAPLP